MEKCLSSNLFCSPKIALEKPFSIKVSTAIFGFETEGSIKIYDKCPMSFSRCFDNFCNRYKKIPKQRQFQLSQYIVVFVGNQQPDVFGHTGDLF